MSLSYSEPDSVWGAEEVVQSKAPALKFFNEEADGPCQLLWQSSGSLEPIQHRSRGIPDLHCLADHAAWDEVHRDSVLSVV